MAILAATETTPTATAVTMTTSGEPLHCRDNVLVIMGATGAGKSRLSIDMATRFPAAEIINTDKLQVYKGLDITTNKITLSEQAGVPHHLLGTFDSAVTGDLSREQFRDQTAELIAQISARSALPILVGGSNSFVYALLTEEFDPECDPFSSSGDDAEAEAETETVDDATETGAIGSSRLRYRCCFLWVDVSLPVLYEYLGKRLDEMIKSGMVDELAKYFQSGESDVSPPGVGLNKAIGVPEFENYFRLFPSHVESKNEMEWDQERKSLYDEAVRQVKENTCKLAKRQREKIQRLKSLGWEIERIDATEAFKKVLEDAGEDGKGKGEWLSVWEKKVVEPSTVVVKRFLQDEE